jgi:hypothetical protein
MNRRQFTASLGAISGAAALPLSAAPAVTSALSPVPAATYSWAQLIVRAQAKTDPAMLARHLKLSPDVAHNLFQTLIRDGILRAPTTAGIAQASKPIQASGQSLRAHRPTLHQIKAAWEDIHHDAEPLVNQESPALGCDNSVEKDCSDACTDEPIQESPQAG